MSQAIDELRVILGSGDFSPLIGRFEDQRIECKGQPYRLESEEQKLELAKDVSALANTDGGLVLIGVATTRDSAHGQDRITAVRPFELARFDQDRYQKVIGDWLWPPQSQIDVRWFPSQGDDTRGVGAIFVPEASAADQPVVVAKTLLDTPRRVEIVFGLCQRRAATVGHLTVERIHTLLRDGSRLDEEIREGFQNLEAALARLHETPSTFPPPDPEERRRVTEQRINDALAAARLSDKPALLLAAVPRTPASIGEIFESRSAPAVQLLDRPPELRTSGFDLDTGGPSRIVAGALRRSVLPECKVLDLYPDGTLIFATRGDGDGLCWGRANRQTSWPLINQLVLAETALLFVELAYRLYAGHLTTGTLVDLHLRILRLRHGTQTARLEAGTLGSSRDVRVAADESGLFEAQLQFGTDPPEVAALRLIAKVYNWFTFESDRIPYTNPDRSALDSDTIREAGRR
ncbi:MAG: ATP-binding protein [Deltaproteobacteria bacterium]|nr:ATP-binding protein [Deltaproteobacteria bacterium]